MRNCRLIGRQASLLRHLTSEAFIFGTKDLESAILDPDLQGMDIGRLRLEAEFSHEKRINRIRETFARTASLFGVRFNRISRQFAVARRPRSYERYTDAKDFFDWFVDGPAEDSSVPEYAADVARVEIALARARKFRVTEAEEAALEARPDDRSSRWYLTHPCTALLRCRFDVGPLFAVQRSGESIVRRDVPLVILASRRKRPPEILEVVPDAFELLERSQKWSRLEPGTTGSESASTEALVIDLQALGLVLAGDGAFEADHG